MKLLKPLFLTAMIAMLLISCEKESIESVDESVDLSAQINVNAKEQTPKALFDTTTKGIYHGVVAHKTTQSRGKIWINMGNNSKYTAIIEMVAGEKLSFKSSASFSASDSTVFKGESGGFTILMNDINNPEIINLSLNNEDYFGYVIKSTSTTRASSYTGTFNQTGGGVSGTWNILSNVEEEGDMNPNGFNGTAISDVMITTGENMYTDTVMELGVYPCAGTNSWTPIVDLNGDTGDGLAAWDQQTNLNGVISWDLGFGNGNTASPSYVDATCTLMSSGTFSWAHPTNGNTITGAIYVDTTP